MRKRTATIVLLTIGWVSAHGQKVLWSVDLAKNQDYAKRLDVSPPLRASPSLSFLKDGRILVSFYDDAAWFDPELERKRFHVLEVNPRTGAFGRELNFSSVDERARVLPVEDGFAVLAGDTVTKFDADFVSVATYPTPRIGTAEHRDVWLMDATPDGGQIALYHRQTSTEQRQLVRLSSTDLSPIRTEPAELVLSQLSVSDDDYIRDSYPAACKCAAHFITNDLVVVQNRDFHYSVEPVTKLGGSRAVADGSFPHVSVSRNSNRIAFSSAKMEGTHGFLVKTGGTNIAGKVTIRDWKRKRNVAEIDIDEPVRPPAVSFFPSLALSSDGLTLLVLLHNTLTAYSLPN